MQGHLSASWRCPLLEIDLKIVVDFVKKFLSINLFGVSVNWRFDCVQFLERSC